MVQTCCTDLRTCSSHERDSGGVARRLRHKMAARQAANPSRPGARVSVPTLGLDGGLLPAGPNTFVDFLAPNPMVLSQRVEELAQANASRKRALPASEPPLEQIQVERVNHLCETRLTEQLVTHRRYRPCTTKNEHRPLSLRPPLAQNGASSKSTIPRLELPLSRIKRSMKEDSCSDPLVRIPASLPCSRLATVAWGAAGKAAGGLVVF